jgi:hypothetical protein
LQDHLMLYNGTVHWLHFTLNFGYIQLMPMCPVMGT